MPKSKYRKISSLSGEELNFKNPYKLPSRLLTKIKKITPDVPPGLITDLENAITTYKFEETVFRRAPSYTCLLYTSPSPRDVEESRMPSSA